MKEIAHTVVVAAVALLQGCGGGDSIATTAPVTPDAVIPKGGPPPLSPMSFVVGYSPLASPAVPAGTVEVSPPPTRMSIGVKPIAKVELLLFGYEAQSLTAPNDQPKNSPQMRYVFRLPATFTSSSYECGSGANLSEVRVTDIAGLMLSKTFEICPGTPLETAASIPDPLYSR